MPLKIAGIIHDQSYFDTFVKPFLNRDIEYLGSVGGEEKQTLLSQASVLLHLVGFDEPFGLSMVEAMACGVPVVAFSRGSIPEVVCDGVSGYTISSVSEASVAVQKALSLSRAKVRAYVQETFSLERMILGYEEIYRNVLEKSSRST